MAEGSAVPVAAPSLSPPVLLLGLRHASHALALGSPERAGGEAAPHLDRRLAKPTSDKWRAPARPCEGEQESACGTAAGIAAVALLAARRERLVFVVRKQYHFWPGDYALDAWDVDRLIRLSRDLPVEQVAVDDIAEIDTVYWFDDREQTPTVRRVVEHAQLIQDVDLSYPIILGAEGPRHGRHASGGTCTPRGTHVSRGWALHQDP